eukprot:2897330-Rhodomonas_salina.1
MELGAACTAADTRALAKLLEAARTRAPDAWQRLCGQDHSALAPWLKRQELAQAEPGAAAGGGVPASLHAIVRTLLA